VKTFSSDLASAYDSGSTTLCACLRILRTDGVVQAFTSADRDVIVGSDTYLAATGLDVSNLVVQAGLAVDNMELTVFPDEVSYPQADIIAGRWDNAKFWLFECDYNATTLAGGSNDVGEATREDINLLKRGTTGEADTIRSTRKFEFRGLKQALQQSVGAVTSKTCRYRLGDENCKIVLNESDGWLNDHAVSSIASRHVFTCSAATEPSDFYGDGKAISLDGLNEGYERKIKSFATGVFTLAMEFPFQVQVGDTFTFVAGCRKRLIEDCQAKFDNVLNFGGEPHLPGIDLLTADPVVSG
jgi:uncharacterized phage protein (TIGR02218 family)